ncbi:MAG: hypothetical protein K2O64_00135, partial [Lactobacillus sp.]|nr:hypothetical protein [Lactobacillus sp.]
IFCDGPRTEEEKKNTDLVRAIAHDTTGFASTTVIERDKNLGCAGSVIKGMEDMFSIYGELIIIEDDVLCSPYTLQFLNRCLKKYEQEDTVFNISAWSPPLKKTETFSYYPYDIYFIPRFECTGCWASWKNRWQRINWDVPDYAIFEHTPYLQYIYNIGGKDLTETIAAQMAGKIDSWAIRMDYARFKHGCLGLNPVYSYTTNIGFGSGTHTTAYTTRFDNDIRCAICAPSLSEYIFVDPQILAAYQNFYAPVQLSLPKRITRKIRRILKKISNRK